MPHPLFVFEDNFVQICTTHVCLEIMNMSYNNLGNLACLWLIFTTWTKTTLECWVQPIMHPLTWNMHHYIKYNKHITCLTLPRLLLLLGTIEIPIHTSTKIQAIYIWPLTLQHHAYLLTLTLESFIFSHSPFPFTSLLHHF